MRQYLVLLVLIASVISCSKETIAPIQPVNPGDTTTIPTTALVDLRDASGNCYGQVVQGSFEPGNSLDTTNKVIVSVYVSRVGTWSLVTTSVNGYRFTGEGSFTATGLQQVTLWYTQLGELAPVCE